MNTVIYHSADYDGIFCREIAKKFLPADTNFIGWNFGDELIGLTEGKTYVLDLSPDCLRNSRFYRKQDLENIVWIDHHKTSIDKWDPNIPGYRIDGVAACRLAWQYFNPALEFRGNVLGAQIPNKQDFVDRKVKEPLAVCLAGEYDILDKRDPRAETFQYGLRMVDEGADFFEALLQTDGVGEKAVRELLAHGESAQTYARKTDASICKYRTWLMEWEGLKFLCVNSARFNSLFFASKDVPKTGHDALLGFCFDGKCWTVSLYHANHRKDLDLSKIAKKHGGGGHRGACGFTCQTLPFQLTK